MTATCGLTAENPRLASTGCNELIVPYTVSVYLHVLYRVYRWRVLRIPPVCFNYRRGDKCSITRRRPLLPKHSENYYCIWMPPRYRWQLSECVSRYFCESVSAYSVHTCYSSLLAGRLHIVLYLLQTYTSTAWNTRVSQGLTAVGS